MKISAKLLNMLPDLKLQIINYTEKKIWALDQQVVYDPSEFTWNSELENNWEIVREEFLNYWQQNPWVPSFHEISRAQLNITNDDKWKMLILYAYGKKVDQTCQYFPQTERLVSRIPGMKSAMFSIFRPEKKVPEHSGNVKMILRYQLPVIVPEDRANCYLRIDNQELHWEEGKGILFDDNYSHEVFNNTNEIRVVLMLDVLRPLSFPLNIFRDVSFYFITKTEKIQSAYQNLDSFYQHG